MIIGHDKSSDKKIKGINVQRFRELGMQLASVERACLLLTAIHILLDKGVYAETFTLGYITGSKRRPGDFEYQRPGYRISGAISLAVEEVIEPLIFPVYRDTSQRPQLARKQIFKSDDKIFGIYPFIPSFFIIKKKIQNNILEPNENCGLREFRICFG